MYAVLCFEGPDQPICITTKRSRQRRGPSSERQGCLLHARASSPWARRLSNNIVRLEGSPGQTITASNTTGEARYSGVDAGHQHAAHRNPHPSLAKTCETGSSGRREQAHRVWRDRSSLEVPKRPAGSEVSRLELRSSCRRLSSPSNTPSGREEMAFPFKDLSVETAPFRLIYFLREGTLRSAARIEKTSGDLSIPNDGRS